MRRTRDPIDAIHCLDLENPKPHVHKWTRLPGFKQFEWRCSDAKACVKFDCEYWYPGAAHSAHEFGCLASLVYVSDRKLYIFCSPGHAITELTEKPMTMKIDQTYSDYQRGFMSDFGKLLAA